MGVFADVVAPMISATYLPTDDFWYRPDPRGDSTQAGYPVNPDTALRQSTVNACVGLISDMIGSLPLHVYRRLDNGGKERATTHPAYNLLHRQPLFRGLPLVRPAMQQVISGVRRRAFLAAVVEPAVHVQRE